MSATDVEIRVECDVKYTSHPVTPSPPSGQKFVLPVFLVDSINDGGATQSFTSLGWNAGWWAAQADAIMRTPIDMTLNSWTAELATALAAGKTITFALVINGVVDGTLTITLTGDGVLTGGRSADGALSIPAGSTVCIQGTASDAAAAAVIVNGFVLGLSANQPVCAVHVFPNASPFKIAPAGSQGAGQNVADFTASLTPFEEWLNPLDATVTFSQLTAQLSAATSGTLQPRVGAINAGGSLSIAASDHASGAINAAVGRTTGAGDVASVVADINATSLSGTFLRLMAVYQAAPPRSGWCIIPSGLSYATVLAGSGGNGTQLYGPGSNFSRVSGAVDQHKVVLRWPNVPGTLQHFVGTIVTDAVSGSVTFTWGVQVGGVGTTFKSVTQNTHPWVGIDDAVTLHLAVDNLVNFVATGSPSDGTAANARTTFAIGFLPD